MSFSTDPIADMLTRIRNASTAKLETVDVPCSKIKTELARILNEEGYIRNFEIRKEGYVNGIIRIHLKYSKDRKSSIEGLRRVSKPGLRIYTEKGKIPRILGGLGTVVLSTSKGVLTGNQAKEIGIGGEIICSVW